MAEDLIDGINADAAIADKGYDADHLVDKITGAGTQVVIPPTCPIGPRRLSWSGYCFQTAYRHTLRFTTI
ncbi:hypothetical protein [Rhizobium ruizarguesonis]|uniref:hypothetical protein n=1 Tax=Rhizobium ruizarguesonis TaxID=2081791 RepID=UPI0037C67D50